MKIILFLFIASITCISNTEAQLIKKLKEKTEKILEPQKNETTNNGSASSNNSSANNQEPKWVPTPDCQLVFTLENDERFFYDETKVIVKNNKMSYSFVVQNKKREYFLIEDGKRNGPFQAPPEMAVNKTGDDDETNDKSDEDINMSGDKDPVALKYSKTINNNLFIVFNGKNFGPYDFVAKMVVSPDKQHFFAVVTIGGMSSMTAKMGMGNTFLVNESGLKQKAGTDNNSMPIKLKTSNDFKQAMVTVMETTTQKSITVTSTGKKLESSMADMYGGNESAVVLSDNGDIISVPSQSPTQLFINGVEAASFNVPVKNMNRLFLTPDIKKSVYYTKGTFHRGDGTEESVKDILFPKLLTINKETALYYYKLNKNETGGNDVYICKKLL